MHNRWYQDAIIYGVDVETYADSDSDGVGDFNGLVYPSYTGVQTAR